MFTDSHDWCNFRNRTEWKQALQSRKKIIQMHELKFTFFPLLFLFFFSFDSYQSFVSYCA